MAIVEPSVFDRQAQPVGNEMVNKRVHDRGVIASTLIRRLARNRRGATAIEYGLLIGLIALAIVVVLPRVSHSVQSIMVTVREGLNGKVCKSDPLQNGIQCS